MWLKLDGIRGFRSKMRGWLIRLDSFKSEGVYSFCFKSYRVRSKNQHHFTLIKPYKNYKSLPQNNQFPHLKPLT